MRLAAESWAVRGTTRDAARAREVESAGIEAAVADPERPGTLLDLLGDVAVVHWLLGTARGEPESIDAIHGQRLRALLERIVDTPVRGFVYEGAGTVPGEQLDRGAETVRFAGETWQIPVAVVEADPADHESWLVAMTDATLGLLR
jgi:hypothetical protein